MNILELLFETKKQPKEFIEKFNEFAPFFKEHENNKNITSVEVPEGAGYLFRGYLYYLGILDEDFILRCIKTLEDIKNAMEILGVKRTLSTFDDIINAVKNRRRKSFITNMNKEAQKKLAEKEKVIKPKEPKPEPKKRGIKPSFKTNLTFSEQGKKGRKPKTQPKRGNPGNIRAEYNVINSKEEYNTFINNWPGKMIAPYDFLKRKDETPVIIVFEINKKGPYFVYTNKSRKNFFVFGESKERGRGGGLIQTPISLLALADKINSEEIVSIFLKKLSSEDLKQMSYSDFINAYYNSNTSFLYYNNKIVVKTWYLILKHILGKFKPDDTEKIILPEKIFDDFKQKYSPLEGSALKSTIDKFNKKNTMTLKEYLETCGELL